MLTFLIRIDNTTRQSTLYERMERAAYRIARLLESCGPVTVVEIARALELDASTVTRQVAAMEARQQATRRVHPRDGRAWEIHLTDIGMIFVRCRAGISHNPLEFVTVTDVGLAVEALIQTIVGLAGEPEA